MSEQQISFPEREEVFFFFQFEALTIAWVFTITRLYMLWLQEVHNHCCFGMVILDLTAEMHIKVEHRRETRALHKRSDIDHCAPHGRGSVKGGTKTVKVRAKNKIWTWIHIHILIKLHSSWPEKVISSAAIVSPLTFFFCLCWFCLLSVFIVELISFSFSFHCKIQFELNLICKYLQSFLTKAGI